MLGFIIIKELVSVAKASQNRTLWFVSILAYVIFLLAMLPLNIVYQAVNPKLPIKVVAVTGTLWNGAVIIKHATTGMLDVQWHLNPASLFIGALSADLKIEGTLINAQTNLVMSLNGDVSLNDGSAYISSQVLKKPLQQQRVKVQGDIELSNLNLVYNMNDRQTVEASGRLIWMGGDVQYAKGRKTKHATLPMLVADLSNENGELLAAVNTTEGLGLATANLKADGWAGIAIQKRMIDLLGEPWSAKASADSVVFEVSEKVF